MSDEDLAVDPEGTSEPQDDAELEESAEEHELSEEEQAMAKLKEAISVEKEEIGALRLKLTVTIPQETLDERRGDQFAELKREALVPGFRKGHAPLVLVEKRFGSDVGEQLKGELIGSGYQAAVEKEALKPLGDPRLCVRVAEERMSEDGKPAKVEVEKLLPLGEALDHIKLPKEGSFVFSCELELTPEFELPALEKIPVERPVVDIDDDDVDAEVRRLSMFRGSFQPVEEGAVEPDDLLYVDMKMSVDGQQIATEENVDVPARDSRLKDIPLPGFGDAVAGKKLGDTFSFEAPVPDDHEDNDLRGKTAEFEFVVREIKRLVLPPVDEEFLSSLGFDTESELRDAIRQSLTSRLDSVIQRGLREQIGQYLIDNTDLDIPEGLSQRQTDRSVTRRMIEMYQAGLPQAEIDKQMDELRSKAHEQAVRDLKLFFVLEKIAEQREIAVTEEEINGAIAEMARQSNQRFDRVRDNLSKGDGLATLYLQLRDQKVLDALLADAEITEKKRPKKTTKKKKKTAKKATGARKTAKRKSSGASS
jgi:trigger factor